MNKAKSQENGRLIVVLRCGWNRSNELGGGGFGFGTCAFRKRCHTRLIGFAGIGIGNSCLATNWGIQRATDNFRSGCLSCSGDYDHGGGGFWGSGFTAVFDLSFGKNDDTGDQNSDHEKDRENYPECFFAV